MRIGLLSLSGVRVKSAELAALGVTLPGFIRRGKVIASLPSLGLLTLAGLTPPEHEVTYIELDELPPAEELPEFDLVGISSFTARVDEAYEIADRYRSRRTAVVMGGLHVAALPHEALEHCDAVVLGGAEGAWPRALGDAMGKCLQRIYAGAEDEVFARGTYAPPRFELLS